MCFVLYAGTSHPIPQIEWRDDAPDVTAQSLTERERPIAAHFSKPHVQFLTSTSRCGCDFPNVMFQNGGWPWFEIGDPDPEQEKRDRFNLERLVALLRSIGEPMVELYGVWDGAFATPPAVREVIAADRILEPAFRFKEQGFYVVKFGREASTGTQAMD